jgi:dolichol kinase
VQTDQAQPIRYLICVTLSGLLEATSTQNDNLVIPIFFWACQSLLEV